MVMKSETGAGRGRRIGRGLHKHRKVSLTLAELREVVGPSQRDVAAASGIGQGDVSRLERRATLDPCEVATLRRYVEALGGELELVAVLPRGHRIAIVGHEGED
jgi:transcriptional regulator with XRE-family HTH domain